MSELWIGGKKGRTFGGKSKNPTVRLAREVFLDIPTDQYKMLNVPNIS